MNLPKKLTKIIFFLFFVFSTLSLPLYSSISKQFFEIVEDKNPLKILTPSLKDISTRKLILSNNIKVFIISDKQARESSAAVAVNVGSWHDPDIYPGMAHFCEHMLFMGSKKYPNENAFWKHVLDNNGTANAYTKPDRTVYMFSINHHHFEKSLDMFSRFFIDPIFSEKSIKRELLAVNQEHNKNIENDSWRSWFIFKKEGNQNHPNAKFSTGTEETLKIIKREELIKWYKNHYKSKGMHLVLYSNKDLDTLTSLVENAFCQVENSTNESISIPYAKISSSLQEGHICYIEPIRDIKELTISWEIPPGYANDLKTKTSELIGYALSHKNDGGLYAYLSNNGLIEKLDYECSRISKNHMLLSFSMSLTKEGILKSDHIIYTFFQALNKLKTSNIPSHIYEDIESVQKTQYCWQSRQNAFQYTMNCADTLIDESLDTFPYNSIMISSFDQKNSRNLLNFLNPENALLEIIGKKEYTHKIPNLTEPWMKAKYSVVKLSNETLQSLREATPHNEISLPNPNPYISKHQKLLTYEVAEKINDPSIIGSDEGSICYFLQDSVYLIPRTQIQIGIKSPAINSSAKSLCLNQLYAKFLQHHLKSLISEGSFAGIYSSISPKNLGVYLSINSYHDKIGSFMMAFLSKLKSSYPTKNEFETVKEQLISKNKSLTKSLPCSQANMLLLSVINNCYLTPEQNLEVLNSISLEDLQSFHTAILEENFAQILIGGNIDKKNALLHYAEIKNSLCAKPFYQKNHLLEQYQNVYTNSSKPIKISKNTAMSGNSSVLFIDNGKFDYNKNASHQVFGSIIKEAFFTELRSKQQTGYIVQSMTRQYLNRLLQIFLVQSTTHYPEELLARYELFLENYNRSIEKNISLERFEKVKTSILDTLKKPPENLTLQLSNLFDLAFTYHGEFDRKEKARAAISNLTYTQFIKDCKNFISRDNNKRLAILMKGSELDEKSFSYKETSPKELAVISQ